MFCYFIIDDLLTIIQMPKQSILKPENTARSQGETSQNLRLSIHKKLQIPLETGSIKSLLL